MAEFIPKELPPRYYLDYFTYLLTFVQRQYGSVLNEEENQFIARFGALSEEGRCLFVRLINRRGCFFRAQKLLYPELGPLEKPLNELLQEEFVEPFSHIHISDLAAILDLFTKPELLEMAPLIAPTLKGLSKYKKPELVRQFLETVPFDDWLEGIGERELVIRQRWSDEVNMLMFLFFGSINGEMTEFVIRDLGNVRFEQFDEEKFTPLFRTRQEAQDKFFLSKTYLQFKELRELCGQGQLPPIDVFTWFSHWIGQHPTWEPAAQPVFDKLALRLGTFLEKHRLFEEALRAYQHTNLPPSRERQIRLLHKLHRLPEAMALCQAVERHPQNADEHFFALDFGQKLAEANQKKRILKSTTQQLKTSDSVVISSAYQYRVEQGVMHHFIEQGQLAVHSENYIWCGFFGLFLWDIIFDEDQQAIHHPLQRVPSDFYSPDFLQKRGEALEQRLQLLFQPEAFLALIEQTHSQKYGMGNPMVGWHESLLDLVKVYYQKLPPELIRLVLMEMAKNLKEHTRGFPDLFVWDDKDYWFIEVKSPNDHLSAQQLYWLQFFGQIGIQAKVLRVV